MRPFRAWVTIPAVLAAVTGLMTLIGWSLNIPALTRIVPGLSAMHPVTAIALIIAGASLWLQRDPPPARESRDRSMAWPALVGGFAGLVVLAIGALRLGQLTLQWPIPFDQVLFAERIRAANPPARMAPGTALSLVFLGLALLGLDVQVRRFLRPAELLAISALIIAALAIMSYVYGIKPENQVRMLAPMAMHTATAIAALSLGVLMSRHQYGLMSAFASPGPGGQVARRFLIFFVIALPLLGWLRLAGQHAGWYDAELRAAISVVSTAVVLAIVAWINAVFLDRADARRRLAEHQLLKVNAELERRVMERTSELSSARDFNAQIIENAQEGIIVYDRDLRYQGWNSYMEKLIGRSTSQIVGRTVAEAFPTFHDPVTETAKRRALMGEVVESPDIQYHIPESGRMVWTSARFGPLRNDRGEIIGVIGTIRDITDRKKSEEAIERLNDELEQRVHQRTAQLADANNEVEAFAYTVSHDLRAPLRAMDGFSRILVEDHGQTLAPEALRYLELVRGNALKMGTLIDDLLTFSRLSRQPLALQDVSISVLARQVVDDLRLQNPQRVVDVQIADLPTCLGDPSLLKQVLINLLANAFKFTRASKPAHIEVGGAPEGGQFVYHVRDNGVGFDMKYADKLFGVFQRLHRAEDYEGTGVGLAIVQRIIHRHGGKVWADSQPGQGTTFFFTLGSPPQNVT